MENPTEPSLLVTISFLIFTGTLVAAIILQFKAMRHMRSDGLRFMFKDPLFRRKELAFDDTGMRFINLQKNIIIVGTIGIVLLLLIDHWIG